MSLPLLPTIKKKAKEGAEEVEENVLDPVADFFNDDKPDPSVARNFARELPKQFEKKVAGPLDKFAGKPQLRAYVGTAHGLEQAGERVLAFMDTSRSLEEVQEEMGAFDEEGFKPQGSFQKNLLGEERISAGEEGRKLREGLSLGMAGESQIPGLDPVLGVGLGLADVFSGGKASKGVELLANANNGKKMMGRLVARYGPAVAKKIDDFDDIEVAQRALIKGGEDFVASKLNMEKAEVTANKLIDTFDEVESAIKRQEVARKEEMARRTAKGESIKEEALEAGESADEALGKARGALAGEQPKAGIASPEDVRLQQDEVDSMFNQIATTDKLNMTQRQNARDGLAKLLGDSRFDGALPQRSEIEQLEKVFTEPFARRAAKMRKGMPEKLKELAIGAVNTPKAIMSSMDMSAPLRQGVVLGAGHPVKATKAFGSMVRSFFSEKHFTAAMDQIHNSKMAPVRNDAGLDLTRVSGQTTDLTKQEEVYMNNFAERVPVVGEVVKASERAYVGFLNKLRADVFDSVAKGYMQEGLKPGKSREFDDLAWFINNATGRGKMPTKKLQDAEPAMNAVFYSPKLLASRFNILNPGNYLKMGGRARKEAMRSIFSFLGGGMAIAGLASLHDDIEVNMDADVELSDGFPYIKPQGDALSSDFGKIKMGNTRYDIWGGFQQWVVLHNRLLAGESVSAVTGEKRDLSGDNPFANRKTITQKFFENKASPIGGLAMDLLRGQNAVGEEVGVDPREYGLEQNLILSRLTPLYMQDAHEVAQEEGWIEGFKRSAPAFFGVGMQTFEDKTGSEGQLPKLPGLPSFPSM